MERLHVAVYSTVLILITGWVLFIGKAILVPAVLGAVVVYVIVGLADTLARTLWGWIAVLTMTLAMCALFLARWWQSLPERAGSFGAEFRHVRLGRVLGIAAALFIGATLFTEQALVGDIGRLLLGSLVIVGLAATHRAVSQGKLAVAWLWFTYALLVLVAPFAVVGLAALGFVDNWLRSGPPARSAAT